MCKIRGTPVSVEIHDCSIHRFYAKHNFLILYDKMSYPVRRDAQTSNPYAAHAKINDLLRQLSIDRKTVMCVRDLRRD